MRSFIVLLCIAALLAGGFALAWPSVIQENAAASAATPEPAAPDAGPAPTTSGDMLRLAPTGTLIQEFGASTTHADPGETIVMNWRTSGGAVTINLTGTSANVLDMWDSLPPAGQLTVTIPPTASGGIVFSLTVSTGDQTESRRLDIAVTCPEAWFFSKPPDMCPRSPVEPTQGIFQAFQHGMMVWMAPNSDHPQAMVRVLLAAVAPKRWEWPDQWQPGMPVSDRTLTAPKGYFQPERALGLVWRGTGSFELSSSASIVTAPVRGVMGWATAPEVPYTLNVQCDTLRSESCWFNLPDGRVIEWWYAGPGWEIWTG